MWRKEQDVVVRPEPKVKRRIFTRKWVVIAFLAILAALFYVAYSGSITPITGNAIGTGETNEPLTGFSMNADMQTLTNPFLLRQALAEINIETGEVNNKIFIGKENILELSELSQVSINLQAFDGDLHFDGNKIMLLEGSVNRITVNGIPTSSANGNIDVRIESEMPYQLLDVKGISLKKYEFADRGTISFDEGKVSLNVNGETLAITGFQGNIKGSETLFVMNGRVENAKTQGIYSFELKK